MLYSNVPFQIVSQESLLFVHNVMEKGELSSLDLAAFLSTYGSRGKMALTHGDPMDIVIP